MNAQYRFLNQSARVLLLLLTSAMACDALADDDPKTESKTTKPNIVLLYSDDAGFADFGFQPSVRDEMKKLTPCIDSLARDGVRLTNGYMSGAVCSPSRAGLMTGRYQSRFGHGNNLPPGFQSGLPLNEKFLAARMQEQGYKTGLVGKWHLGYPEKFRPNQRGFDWFFGCLQGSRSYYPSDKVSPNRAFRENDKPLPDEGYTTDRMGDGAIRFINENKDKPFFLIVSFTAPHGPLQAKKEDLKFVEHIEKKKRRSYAALVKTMDTNVGRILDCLRDNKLEQNTLVIFTNDNGGQTLTGANNHPLRGKKGDLYEGGVRVPWALRWPGKIKPKTVIDDPIVALDLAPTLINLAGGIVDPAWKLDGTDITHRLLGKQKQLPERTLFWRRHGKKGAIACRKGKWKLVFNRHQADAKPELYDLSQDLPEEKNIVEQHPEIVTGLQKEIATWESQLTEPLWGKNSAAAGNSSLKKRDKQKKKSSEPDKAKSSG